MKPAIQSSFHQGFREGYTSAQEKHSDIRAQLLQLMTDLKVAKQEMVFEALSEVRAIVQETCFNILRKHLEANPEEIAHLVQKNLQKSGAKTCVVAVNAATSRTLKSYLQDLPCKIEIDNSIANGEFEVHLDNCSITLASLLKSELG